MVPSDLKLTPFFILCIFVAFRIIFEKMDQDQQFSFPSHIKSLMVDSVSGQDNSQQISSPSQRTIQSANINQLYKSRDNLRQFAMRIGGQCSSPVRHDVIEHCNKIRVNWTQNLGFEKIEKMVKNRIQKMIKNKRIKKNWSEEDIIIFIWIVSKYADFKGAYNVSRDLNQKDWDAISDLIPGVEAETCMFKWLGLRKCNLSQNCWSERESNLLQKIVKKFGETDWSLIAQKLYYANTSSHKIYRCPKQCREHWNCYLNPKLKKGPWSKEEDILLLSSVLKNSGQKKWAEIVKDFDGRTENALKNRYTLIIDKQIKSMGNNNEMSQIDIIKQYLQRIYIDQFMNIDCENGSSGNLSQSKLKELNSVIKNAQQTPKREVRTSLRRRESMKSKISKNQEDLSPNISYCDILIPKIDCEYPLKSTKKSSQNNMPSQPKTPSQRKNTSKINKTKTQSTSSLFKIKRWNSTPQIFEDEEFESKSTKKNHKMQKFCSSFNTLQENDQLSEPYNLNYKSEVPIFQEESDCNIYHNPHPSDHHHNPHNYHEFEDSLMNIYQNSLNLDKFPLLSPQKNVNQSLYGGNNLFCSFGEHIEPEPNHNHTYEQNHHESPLSFHSFQQFVMNYDDFESQPQIDYFGANSEKNIQQKRKSSQKEDAGTAESNKNEDD